MGVSEAVVQQRARVEHPAHTGGVLWRNNSGACTDDTGRLIRYGLGNDSAALNREIKSSDLIGITPVRCYVEGRGWTVLGVFTAFECKPEGWHQTPGDKRAIAQARFHDIVRQAGGFAGFITSLPDMWRALGMHGYNG